MKPPRKPTRPKPLKEGSIKPTIDQYQARVDLCITLLATRMHKSQIKSAIRQFVAKQMGIDREVSARTCEEYLSRAREQMAERRKQTTDQHINNGLGLYEQLIRDSKTPHHVKLRAQERIDILLGIEAPKRTEITGAEGAPLLVPPGALEALELVYGRGRAANGKG